MQVLRIVGYSGQDVPLPIPLPLAPVALAAPPSLPNIRYSLPAIVPTRAPDYAGSYYMFVVFPAFRTLRYTQRRHAIHYTGVAYFLQSRR
ncbi:hypothetical protein [Bacteroides hominis]